MNRTLGTCALLGLLAMTASCSFKIFEDIGSDPHPPSVEIISLVHYVPPAEPVETAAATAADRAGSPPQGRSVAWDSGGFTLSAGQQFYIKRSYTDAGGDIMVFHLRDQDGSTTKDLSPTDLTYFTGTSGVAPKMTVDPDTLESTVPLVEVIDLAGILGPHHLEIWAEDSHGSRSEKVEFVVTLAN